MNITAGKVTDIFGKMNKDTQVVVDFLRKNKDTAYHIVDYDLETAQEFKLVFESYLRDRWNHPLKKVDWGLI